MTDHRRRVWAGTFTAMGGVLLAVAISLLGVVASPEIVRAGLDDWLVNSVGAVAFADEMLFFGVILLVAGVLLAPVTPITGAVTRAAFAVAGASGVALVIIAGRLAYSVYGIQPTGESLALLVSLLFGTLHTLLLAQGLGIVMLAIATIQLRHRGAMIGFAVVAGTSLWAGAFPWNLPSWVTIVGAVVSALWFVAWCLSVNARTRRDLRLSRGPVPSSTIGS